MSESSKVGFGQVLLLGVLGFLGALIGGVVGTLVTFFVIVPAREASNAVESTAKVATDLIRDWKPERIESSKKSADPARESDPLEAVRYFLDNIRAGRTESMDVMCRQSYTLDRVRKFLEMHPLPRREAALDKTEIKELPAIDDKARIYSWTTTSTNNEKLEFRIVLVNITARSTNPFWWLVESVECTASGVPEAGGKK